jgi:hypothetical protein
MLADEPERPPESPRPPPLPSRVMVGLHSCEMQLVNRIGQQTGQPQQVLKAIAVECAKRHHDHDDDDDDSHHHHHDPVCTIICPGPFGVKYVKSWTRPTIWACVTRPSAPKGPKNHQAKRCQHDGSSSSSSSTTAMTKKPAALTNNGPPPKATAPAVSTTTPTNHYHHPPALLHRDKRSRRHCHSIP